MTPGLDGITVIVASGAAGEEIAHLVHADAQAGFVAPSAEQIACLPVQVSEGLAIHTSLGRGAEFGHRGETGQEAFGVDRQSCI